MNSNKPLFFGIVGLALMIVLGMVLVRVYLASQTEFLLVPPTPGPQEISITIVVAPELEKWAKEAAQSFSQANPQTQVVITKSSDLIPAAKFQAANPPAAWLAPASFVVAIAGEEGLAFDPDRPAVASTALAWGTFKLKQDEFDKQGGLSWDALHQRATEPNSTLKVVIASPHTSAEGLAALISAAAANRGQQTLSEADASQANPWLTETLAESARGGLLLGPEPASAFATRGGSVGDVGLLSRAAWRKAGLHNRADFILTDPQFNVTLDYPFALWAGSPPAEREAALAFRQFLLEPAQQTKLATYFFEPAGQVAPNSVQADGRAALNLQRWAERELR
jgi:hypothetical protein